MDVWHDRGVEGLSYFADVPDRHGNPYLYEQIAEIIRGQIASGELPPGSLVPSENALTDNFSISRDTARNVLNLLLEEELIYTLRGVGTFVGPPDAPRQVIKLDSKFRKIAADLAKEIKDGVFRPANPLPSEIHLVQRFEVATGTVREAMELLREQGWVYTVAHEGTFVSPPEDWPQEQ
ncbi:GntR family transcriptional regulator [Acrocarpospora catenulata]|uniref:GntR family transcriptional regulator n=1 Tax=Acrocarpospora catenulata TaxID=2836182 RepID=UPI001BDA5C1D|nr:GntR family transcriptional regulator [Acrocarpospora catenulata]